VVAELLLPVEFQVLGDGETDLVLAEQADRPALGDRGKPCGYRVYVDRGRKLAFQAEQDGLVAAVSLPGQAERAVQAHAHLLDLRHQAVFAQPDGEHPGCLHRPDGVRARRADTHLEQVKHADRHARSSRDADVNRRLRSGRR
jgi:hypothetical protein